MLPPPLPPVRTNKPRVMAAEDFAGHRNLPHWMRAAEDMRKAGITRASYAHAADYFAEVGRRMMQPPPLPLPLPLPPLPQLRSK